MTRQMLLATAVVIAFLLGLVTREILDWLKARLDDPRVEELITHPLSELLRTELLCMALGWRDQDDADALRDDPAGLGMISGDARILVKGSRHWRSERAVEWLLARLGTGSESAEMEG